MDPLSIVIFILKILGVFVVIGSIITVHEFGHFIAARMAGVPSSVLVRSREILAELEEKSEAPKAIPASTQRLQLTLFDVEEPPVVKALQGLDVNQLTPLDALRLLDEWKRKFGK